MKVDWPIHNEWLQWMKEVHIPSMLITGFFIESRLLRILEVDETDGPTYAVQYYAESIDVYNLFMKSHSAIQSQIEFSKWGDKFVAFSTIMEVVH